MNKKHKDEIVEITHAVSFQLKQIYGALEKEEPIKGVLFPYKRDDGLRISEQEARTLFILELNKRIQDKKSNFSHYSIETPTKHTYSGFAAGKPKAHKATDKGTNSRSGSIDLSIYADDYLLPAINIEFKANNPKPENIKKDLLKLYHESPQGVYFHIYKRTEGTYNSVFAKINALNEEYRKEYNKELLILIVSLEEGGLELGLTK